MKKKIFAVSDIHNCHADMIRCLNEAGYDENNENHLLVVLGDCFDRTPNGGGAVAIYEYLKRLSDEGKAIVIRGNHDDMFIDYLTGKCITPFNYMYNGTRETFADFLHETAPFETWCMLNDRVPMTKDFAEWVTGAVKEINEEYPELLSWLESLPYYYETKKYIFTHGAIDTKIDDWHKGEWKRLVWDDGSFFGESITNTDKIVVIGHFHTRHLREMYGIKDNGGDSILTRNDGKVIALDTCTILTHKVNVLVVEDEI